MVLLSVFAVVVLIAGPGAWGPFGPLLLAGTVMTAIERIVIGVRRLA
jgi:hypothetical protein